MADIQVDPYAAISDAIEDGDLDRLKALFSQFPSMIFFQVPAFGTWLHFAAAYGTLEIVEFLLDRGIDINAGGEMEGNALSQAASKGRFNIAKYLLDKGALIDTSSSIRNPLFAAISGSMHINAAFPPPTGEAPQITRLLLEHGIDSTVRYDSDTMKNMDAVAFAMMMGARELARMIALWNANGDEQAAQVAMDQGLFIAHQNTVPVNSDEDYAES